MMHCLSGVRDPVDEVTGLRVALVQCRKNCGNHWFSYAASLAIETYDLG